MCCRAKAHSGCVFCVCVRACMCVCVCDMKEQKPRVLLCMFLDLGSCAKRMAAVMGVVQHHSLARCFLLPDQISSSTQKRKKTKKPSLFYTLSRPQCLRQITLYTTTSCLIANWLKCTVTCETFFRKKKKKTSEFFYRASSFFFSLRKQN